MNFLARIYVTAQQRLFGCHEAPLSRAEMPRVLRAFYRRQIICNAWAAMRREGEVRWAGGDMAAISNASDHQGVRLGLFAVFTVWELQQIDRIHHFISRLCAALRRVREELEGREELRSLAVVPVDEVEFGKIISRSHERVYHLRSHPVLVEAALNAVCSLARLTGRENYDAPPAQSQLLEHNYCLPFLCYAWQASRFDHFPDPVSDRSDDQHRQHSAGGRRGED